MLPLTDAARAALTSRSADVQWGVDALDLDGARVPAGDVLGCRVSYSLASQIKRSCEVTVPQGWLSRPLSSVRVRPWQSVGGHRFDLGVFDLVAPSSLSARANLVIDGYDVSAGLRFGIGDAYVVPASTLLPDAVQDAVALAGLTGVPLLIDPSAEGRTVPTAMVWVDPNVTPIRIVNDLAARFGFQSVFSDERGRLRFDPFVSPGSIDPGWTFDTADVGTDITLPDLRLDVDVWDGTTVWVFVAAKWATAPADGDGLYTVDRSAGGARRVKTVILPVEDQAALVQRGDAQVLADLGGARSLTLKTGPAPFLGHGDVYRATVSELGVDQVMRCTNWDQDLGALTSTVTLGAIGG